MQKNSGKIILLLIVAAVIGAFFTFDLQQYFSLAQLKQQRDALAAFAESRPVLSIGGYFVTYVLMAALSLPGAAILTIAGGTIFGLTVGTIAVSFASSIGATLAFLAARFLFRDSVRKRFKDRLKRIDEGIEKDGGFYLFSLRLVPIFPFFVINLVAGLTPLKPWTFYWVSQLGMLPGTIVYVNAGTQLGQVSSAGDIVSPSLIGAFVLLAILPFLARWGLSWLQARRVRARFDRPRNFDYNLIVIGGGSAGLVTSYIAAAINAKVALIERDKMGGECLNTGCVPSKALLKSAALVAAARDSKKLGISKMDAEFSFADVMARVHEVIAKIAPHGSVERYTKLGVDCIEGEAKVVSPWAVEVNGRTLTARSIVIATGSRPVVTPIDGLKKIDFLTSDSLWDLQEQPKKLVVLGGGPIGCELTQAFHRLGSNVTLVEMAPQLLGREDEDASNAVLESLRD
ncbi:MAG: FAD-dependent oxidoreductase, partial [Woeseia sp.]|nr:FAD-dependent oxidoreductase [Woeseia sp.]